MVRVLILTFTLIGIVALATPRSFAGSMAFKHSDYVHMSDQEKDEYAKMVMKLFVELENRYRKDIRANNTNSEDFKLYTSLLFTLRSFLIPDAHASVQSDWTALANRLSSALGNGNKNNLCIFAGWASSMGSNNLCKHPRQGAPALTYQSTGCTDPSKVSCNPIIFGYAKASTGTPLCVSSRDNARNSSLDCMEAALQDTPGGDTKDQRLLDLRGRLESNPTVVDSIYKFMYQACVCDTSVMNESYNSRIRPHRTCYGLMNMMKNVKESCSVSGFTALNLEFLSNVQSVAASSCGQNCSLDGNYESARLAYKNAPGNRTEIAGICPSDRGRDPADDPDTGGDIVVTAPDCKATCTFPTPGEPPQCTEFKKGDGTAITLANGTSATYKQITQNNAQVWVAEIKQVIAGETPEETTAREPIQCPIDQPQEDTSCTAKCTPGEGEAAPTCSEYKRGEATLTVATGTEPSFSDDKQTVTIQTILPGQTAASSVACTVDTSSDDDNGKQMTLELTLGKLTRTQQTVTAVVKESGKTEELDGVTFEWYQEDMTTVSDDSSDDTEDDSGASDTVRDAIGDSTDDDTDDGDDIENMEKLSGDGKSVTVGRKTSDVEVCVIVKKTGFEEQSACKVVEKLNARDAIPGTGMPGGMQLTAPGGSRALGIQ